MRGSGRRRDKKGGGVRRDKCSREISNVNRLVKDFSGKGD